MIGLRVLLTVKILVHFVLALLVISFQIDRVSWISIQADKRNLTWKRSMDVQAPGQGMAYHRDKLLSLHDSLDSLTLFSFICFLALGYFPSLSHESWHASLLFHFICIGHCILPPGSGYQPYCAFNIHYFTSVFLHDWCASVICLICFFDMESTGWKRKRERGAWRTPRE